MVVVGSCYSPASLQLWKFNINTNNRNDVKRLFPQEALLILLSFCLLKMPEVCRGPASSPHPPCHHSSATAEERKAISYTFSWTPVLKYASKPLTVKRSIVSSFIDARQTPLQISYSVLEYRRFLAVETTEEIKKNMWYQVGLPCCKIIKCLLARVVGKRKLQCKCNVNLTPLISRGALAKGGSL